MRKAVRAIIRDGDRILVMRRNKFGKEYYTLLGGNIEVGETPEEAVLREVEEESSLRVVDPQLVLIEEAGDPFGTQFIFVCTPTRSSEPQLKPGSEEEEIHRLGKNLYTPMWLPIDTLERQPFLSRELKNRLIDGLKNGFKDEPETFRSKAEIGYTNE